MARAAGAWSKGRISIGLVAFLVSIAGAQRARIEQGKRKASSQFHLMVDLQVCGTQQWLDVSGASCKPCQPKSCQPSEYLKNCTLTSDYKCVSCVGSDKSCQSLQTSASSSNKTMVVIVIVGSMLAAVCLIAVICCSLQFSYIPQCRDLIDKFWRRNNGEAPTESLERSSSISQEVSNVWQHDKEIADLEISLHSVASNTDDRTDAGMCQLCLERDRTVVVFPCKHACLCSECFESVMNKDRKCVVCRKDIESHQVGNFTRTFLGISFPQPDED
ncbi:hypothetical protein GUITHDRAFT_106802 [Guillardia theta CCMP2712]|uniref:RING-type domain-containing protein n=1 Tax=Guillardia theta (strain CCMP2712) TaxID=905079 RepID=L1JGY9_GUITC|nr:hypothetical protein GUITHDRAFT_106802 [Guillardia theta CCMP2712]EKX47355.1 hypothetical protein GUITHDRAFT_106802 [Guillardia theta CCMP2712]|eukprot:XP_005834335.1 hypothetical protein GUITHDRAFT_106802 [Guillardia theta CCMP2712]